jgi:hypothetical protein
MKTKSGPHLGWPNIDANNTGPAYIGDGSLASSMGSTPTQAFAPCDPWERPDLTATSGEVSASHDLRLHCPQPLPPPPTRVATWNGLLRAARDVQELEG